MLCYNPEYPVYEKQTFAYDGWRVIQEHKKTDGNGIPMATAIPVARQFTYGNYLDEALTVDADTDSDGDCLDSGGSTRYYYHQNSLFSVAALSDTSANYKEGYQYDPYGRHVRITDGNDGDTYVNFNTNDARSAGAASNYGNPYLFTGQRLDSESGLYYYKMRYYSTSQGRFISRDPVGYIEGENLYTYAHSMPMILTDEYGLKTAGNANTWTYGEFRMYAIMDYSDHSAPSGLGDAKASIAATCSRNPRLDCRATDGSKARNPHDRAAWRNIVAASGGDKSNGAEYFTINIWPLLMATYCKTCRCDEETKKWKRGWAKWDPEITPATVTVTTKRGTGTIYFYSLPNENGFCTATDEKNDNLGKCKNKRPKRPPKDEPKETE